MAKYANIIIDITSGKLDRTFQYLVPEELEHQLKEGMQVLVPFGKGEHLRKGFLVELTDRREFFGDGMKAVGGIAPEQIPVESQLIALASWMRENFGGTMSQALKTVLPVKRTQRQKESREVRLIVNEEQTREFMGVFEKKHAVARMRLLGALEENKQIPMSVLMDQLNIGSGVITALEKMGILEVTAKRTYRNPFLGTDGDSYRPQLNEQQKTVFEQINEERKSGKNRTFLLQGITGSGKTEVYMELIAKVLEEGKQVILLIPEIALTFQTVMRFFQRFGDRVSILNSKLSPGERFDQLQRAKNGQVDVMIGPRSALFTPFSNLGLIVIDEEHEASYKSETVPRYHARETAIERAKMTDASVVLGSATPSVASYYRAQRGDYKLYKLTARYEDRELPKVHLVDLREELKRGNRSIFSEQLDNLMKDRLEKGQQIMLFLNRRGSMGFVSCRACGHVMKCPHCDVSLTEHNNGRLVCHYCGYERPKVVNCPECGSTYIGGFKAGTEKIEELVKKRFPNARVLRMDADTTKKKAGYETILSAFANQEADVLIGTQMIVKGHDFKGVTLVGILAADLSLHVNDYLAAERTFQLLTQAAGRAGRGTEKGEVVIQTYSPDHYSVITAQNQDYEAFYEQEISYRQLLQYPPVSHLMVLLLFGKTKERAEQAAEKIYNRLNEIKDPEMQLIGPADASVAKVSDIYRKIIYCKDSRYQNLVMAKRKIEPCIQEQMKQQDITVQFDFNPMNGF
ncbi:MAG: primosomal protein N' [Lachnospiraceae bacterium]